MFSDHVDGDWCSKLPKTKHFLIIKLASMEIEGENTKEGVYWIISQWIFIFNFFSPELLPDAIRSDCSKCTPTQKRNSKKVITFLRTRRPKDWDALITKYDPQGLFKQRVDAGLVWCQHSIYINWKKNYLNMYLTYFVLSQHRLWSPTVTHKRCNFFFFFWLTE